jgi:sulfur carrier protein ThiS
MSTNPQPILVTELNEATQSVPYQTGMTISTLLASRSGSKSVEVMVNSRRVTKDYVLQEGDMVQLVPAVEAGN